MARQKQVAPLKRQPSSSAHLVDERSNGASEKPATNGSAIGGLETALAAVSPDSSGFVQLLVCVGGIYASFLSWALLQERITTTTYDGRRFTYSIVLNTVQSLFAACTGWLYLYFSTPASAATRPAVFPSRRIFAPLLLVAVTSSLASPFGYAALSHVDYITFILAKSCKLLPVMFLHLTVFRKRYPLHKYLVVGLVTAGVAVFTLHQPSSSSSSSKKKKASSGWGLFLLGINLLFDGLTNSTQDHIFGSFRPYSGPQMMVAQNVLSTLLTATYLVALPLVPPALLGLASVPAASASELASAAAFLGSHPAVLKDVLGFAACGAVGQIFIYHTLSRFSSLLLVTVTVTRKMLTMMLSVLWFGHRLSGMQWLGVGLVFGGVGAEGWIARADKAKREREKAAAAAGGKKKTL